MIDWDKLVNGPVMGVFGEQALFQPAAGGAFNVTGTFHEAYLSVDVGGNGVTSVSPALGVRLSQFAAVPLQGDGVVITATALHDGGTYTVKEVQRNGVGLAVLLLNWESD